MLPNELIFLIHIFLLSGITLITLRFGKEALISWICLQCVLANLFITKQTTLFGLTATTTDAFTIGSVLGLNFLQEYYGKKIAQQAIWINLGILLAYMVASQLQLVYAPSCLDTMQVHYQALLSFMPQIVIASVTVFFIAQQLDYFLYGFFNKIFLGRFLVMRNYLSVAICQLVDTILFTVCALQGIADNIMEIIIVSYTIKLLAIVVCTPAIAITKYISFRSRNV